MATPETPTTEEIWHWLSQVPDLEIPVISLTERGIIRAVEWQGDGVLQVAIKRVPGGAFSTWANTALTAGDVIAAPDRRLGQTTLGDPRAEGVRMGPVVGKGQREEVLNNIRLLQAEVEIVSGDPEAVRLLAGDPSAGPYLNPVLLYCDTPLKARAVHEVEAFGPVATVMPYDDTQEAVALARLGKGSLVASVFTIDRGVAEEVVLGLAPFHGRVMIGNRASAKTSTGHGSPLAQLVHGGPGRAGGGEEMVGMRGVKHYMQRTAILGAGWPVPTRATPRCIRSASRWQTCAPAME